MHLKLLLQWSSEVITSIQNREAVYMIHMGELFSTKINAKERHTRNTQRCHAARILLVRVFAF